MWTNLTPQGPLGVRGSGIVTTSVPGARNTSDSSASAPNDAAQQEVEAEATRLVYLSPTAGATLLLILNANEQAPKIIIAILDSLIPSMPVQLAPNERPQTVEAAREIINELRRDRGNIDANDEIELSKTSPEWQQDYKEREEKRRKDYARYTKTVADQLYTSKFRFIHELLQNADDAEYDSEVFPTLTFRVRPDELIVDSNERGFTRANVQAICSTGESSKLQNLDTTGEKGLGFKSNFGIANKIHVQSGLWSFRFEHSRGASGLGMVTPIWTQSGFELLPAGTGTRFRLTYTTPSEAFADKIVDEFDKVTDTILFALRKLEKIVIAYEDVRGREYQKSFERVSNVTTIGEAMTITTSISGPTINSSTRETLLRITRIKLNDLPSDEWRSSDTSEIALGFQVTQSGAPFIPTHGQHVFAYLPVQRLQKLPFIVQGDFVLVANREAIPETDWNSALIDGVARALGKAVLGFCKPGDPLKYKWMEYLPSELATEGIWSRLQADIAYSLSDLPVVESRLYGSLVCPRDLRIIPKTFSHQGEPLLADLPGKDVYLSEHYSGANRVRLKTLGLAVLSTSESLARIQHDVSAPESQLRTTDLEDDWHSSFLSTINFLLSTSTKEKVKSLQIIPLATRDWVSQVQSTGRDQIYLPYAVEEDLVRIEIPSNVGLRKLHCGACKVGERRSVYAKLGISQCDPTFIVRKILDAQTTPVSGSLLDYVQRLELLFWFGSTPRAGSTNLKAVSENNIVFRTTKLFFRSPGAYHAADLLGEALITDVPAYNFINATYTDSSVGDFFRHGRSWMQWLENVAGVRHYPELLDEDRQSLHPLLKVAARDNSPKFLAALREHWRDSYSQMFSSCSASSLIRGQISQMIVRCRNGQTCPLSSTMLPTSDAMTKSHDFGVEDHIYLLSLPLDALVSETVTWDFLRTFGVICETNLSFHFNVLEALTQRQLASDRKPEAIIKVYRSIVQISTLGDATLLKEKFSSGRYICDSPTADKWHTPEDCIWSGPSVLWTRPIISKAYAAFPEASKLFVDLLGLRDADCGDLLGDLTKLRDTFPMPGSIERLELLYQALSDMADTTDKAAIRDTFEMHGLIYIQDRWIKPSQAIWNCTIPISGLQPIGEVYPTFEAFFRNKVGVRTMSLKVLAEQLVKVTKTGASPDGVEVKALMINIGQVLTVDRPSQDVRDTLQDLRHNRYLPVQRGEGWVFSKASGNFFIVDHERFAAAFIDKVNLLDFTYPELSSLHPLLQVLGLERRYLSQHIETETAISEGTSDASPDLSRHFRQRAYALSCCAIFHQSPHYLNQSSKLHKLLESLEVLLCNDIWTNLIIRTADGDVETRSDRALVKIEQTQNSIKIYVPSDEAGLYSSLRTELPLNLSSLLGITHAGAAKQVYRILNDEASTLDAIMEDEDIPQVTWLEKPPDNRQYWRSQNSTMPSLSGQIQNSLPASPSRLEDSSLPGSIPSSPPPSYPDGEVLLDRLTGNRAQHFGLYPGGIIQQVVQKNAYRHILQNVLKQARQVSINGHRTDTGTSGPDAFSMSNLAAALDDLEPAALHRRFGLSGNQSATFAETSKLGAAGELYVFERLLGLDMPGFTCNNWQSTIRSLVSILPEYCDLKNWALPEVSDLVYKTTSDIFEDFLRGNSFNSFPSWPAATGSTSEVPIEYLIEVKTTTGASSTPFFMSRNQYQLMEDSALSGEEMLSERPKTVYIIFRVCNLASARIGLKIFVDPWRLRNSSLKFKSGSWTVTCP